MNYKKIFHCIKLCDFLTHEEVEMVQSYMDEERLPQPKGWSNALWLGFSRDVIKNFNLDKPYNVEELEDLKMTLEDMNFPYKEIFWKIDSTIYKTKTKRKSEEKE